MVPSDREDPDEPGLWSLAEMSVVVAFHSRELPQPGGAGSSCGVRSCCGAGPEDPEGMGGMPRFSGIPPGVGVSVVPEFCGNGSPAGPISMFSGGQFAVPFQTCGRRPPGL